MGMTLKSLIALICLIPLVFAGCGKPMADGTVRVALTRDDNVPVGVWQGFDFDKAEIDKTLEKYPTKFPDPLPEGVQVVMFYPGRVFGLFQKVPGEPSIRLTLDVNANRDLTDDAPIAIPKVESWKEGIIVRIARPFTAPESHTEWLPYRIFYRESAGAVPHWYGEVDPPQGWLYDEDGNSDLAGEKAYDIPVLDDPAPDESKMVKADCRIYYKDGAIGFGGFPFFARPAGEAGVQPDIYFQGTVSDFAGTFFNGREEYRLDLTDPNGDRLMTEEDMGASGLLKLKVKKGETWTDIYEGTIRIPIGRSLYRLRYISDDGYLVELEKEK
jgi:hypothetical protein